MDIFSWSLPKSILLAVLMLMLAVLVLSNSKTYPRESLSYGVTFSKKKAVDLGLDWREAYTAMFDDLGAKKVRLPAYWDEVETADGTYVWDDLDWQINEAEARGAELIIAVGGRLPRWPECHFPDWSEGYSKPLREERVISYLKAVVLRYRERNAIIAWQVENEPFLAHFGDCPELDSRFLDMEIGLVRSLDSRPVVITDSGELSVWVPAARRADIFGTTMYRDTYSKHLKSYIHYPVGPGFFQFKRNVARLFADPKEWIVIELQAEPWGPVPYEVMSKSERARTMDVAKFGEILEFARLAGFKEFYLWGYEWWYWEKSRNNDPRMWEAARGVFNRNRS